MVAIDSVIDDSPTAQRIADLAELRNRNILAFEELQHFNDTGTFKFKHPLIIHYSLHSELKALKKRNPDEFLEQYANTRDNVKRYNSYLKRKGRPQEKLDKDRENLKKHLAKEQVFKEVLSNE